MTHADFLAWHERMGYTYDTGAAALGVNRSTYANLLAGHRRDSGTPVVYDRRTALACAALEAGLRPLGGAE
ncbi:hypothetical protein [Diaphorobacter sp.]|uniref:hypothetical protein n=1 Tax=Diaphorobacter sp. TaxID=1934310 RepID=UPI0025840580|nr:hypothetical protein [Diaphorobacter sp.]